MNGRAARSLQTCNAVAINSLPVPDSPSIKTEASDGAAVRMIVRTWRSFGLLPTIPKSSSSNTGIRAGMWAHPSFFSLLGVRRRPRLKGAMMRFKLDESMLKLRRFGHDGINLPLQLLWLTVLSRASTVKESASALSDHTFLKFRHVRERDRALRIVSPAGCRLLSRSKTASARPSSPESSKTRTASRRIADVARSCIVQESKSSNRLAVDPASFAKPDAARTRSCDIRY